MREGGCLAAQLLGLLDQVEQLPPQLYNRTIPRVEKFNGAIRDWPLALRDGKILRVEVREPAEMAARHGAAILAPGFFPTAHRRRGEIVWVFRRHLK